MILRYELDEGSTTFWEIEKLDEVSFVCRWGKVGATARNERNYAFVDQAAAEKAAGKLIAERTKQGFALIGGKRKADDEVDDEIDDDEIDNDEVDDDEIDDDDDDERPAKNKNASDDERPAKKKRNDERPAQNKASTIEVVTTTPAKTGLIGNPKLEDIIADNPDDAGSWQVYADWLIENGEPWGEVIAAAATGKRPKKEQDEAATKLLGELDGSSLSWRFGTIEEASLCPEEGYGDGDDSKYKGALKRILKHPGGRLVRSLELGLPPGPDCDWSYEPVLPALRKAGRLPLLATLDMSVECEFMDQESWRSIGDLSKLWTIAPRLRELRLRGSSEAEPTTLGDIVAPYLETFVHISSGLNKSVAKDLGRAHLPELSHLELYLGQEDYGLSTTLKSLAGIFAGEGLPRLSYLGLVNSEWEAELIAALAAAPIVKRIRTLDLSKGTMWRASTAALIEHAAAFRHLERLDLEDNYFTTEQQQAIAKVIPCASFGDQKDIEDDEDDDDPYRYVTVGE